MNRRSVSSDPDAPRRTPHPASEPAYSAADVAACLPPAQGEIIDVVEEADDRIPVQPYPDRPLSTAEMQARLRAELLLLDQQDFLRAAVLALVSGQGGAVDARSEADLTRWIEAVGSQAELAWDLYRHLTAERQR